MTFLNSSSKKLPLIGMAAFMLFNSSCTDKFDSWNTNPHDATKATMEMDNLSTGSYFVQMQKNVFVIEQLPKYGASVFQTIQSLAGDIYSGYMGACGTWNAGSNNTTYDLSIEWKDAAFERAFVGVMPAWREIKEESAKLKQPQVGALATIVKVEAMHRLTDMYGPLPYTRFGNGELKNEYDTQEAIYNSFFTELTQAINILTDFNIKNPDSRVLESYDYIYSGNVTSWIKFANTLKLRLAMRIAYATPDKAKAMAEEAVNHPIGVMVDKSDIAKLNHSEKLSYRNLLYVVGQGEFNDNRMGATIDSYMNGYSDPRIRSYFKLSTAGKFTGIRTGINIVRGQYAETAPFSDLNVNASTDMVWVNPSESYFLRAEGALRGWNMGGTSQELYEKGIRTSFDIVGASGIDAYIQDNTHIPAAYTDPSNSGNNVAIGDSKLGKITIKWDETASFENKLERIITQKWLAIFPDGQEAWSEFRRTNYPRVLPVVINRSAGKISTERQIRRIPFPGSEYRTNRENVVKAVQLLGGEDNGGTNLWWDKKN